VTASLSLSSLAAADAGPSRGFWDGLVQTVSGLVVGMLVIVAVLAVAGIWIAGWSLWRTRGSARES
jgi:type IV secretory pathway VirB2 component (pilin)